MDVENEGVQEICAESRKQVRRKAKILEKIKILSASYEANGPIDTRAPTYECTTYERTCVLCTYCVLTTERLRGALKPSS